jgi:hypothetical protein
MQVVNVGTPSAGGALLIPAGSGATLLTNSDPANTVFLGNSPSFDFTVNSVPLGPTQNIVFDGNTDVYAATQSGTAAVYVIPGGMSFFQLLRKLVIEAGTPGSGLFIYNGPPAHGNLLLAITAGSGTDPFGNRYSGPGIDLNVVGGKGNDIQIRPDLGAMLIYAAT